MTPWTWLPVRVRKEVRALLPVWASCAFGLVVATRVSGLEFAVAVYLFGAVSLGALSMGHEYSHRTLAGLLAQPVARKRLLLAKAGVLASMLLGLGALAMGVLVPWLHPVYARPLAPWGWVIILLLPVLSGVVVAPWLTMLCRSPLAGLVFTLAIPAGLWIAGDLLAFTTYRTSPGIPTAVLGVGMLVVAAVAAVSGWWMFMRLEVIEGGGPEVHAPRWLERWVSTIGVSTVPPGRHRVWWLVRKELHLQQLTLAVAGLYATGCAVVSLIEHEVPHTQTNLISVLTLFEVGLIPLVAGSLASAEERQLGTLEWQALLPVAAWKSWAVKAGLTMGLAWVLATALPTVLTRLDTSAWDRHQFGLLESTGVVLLLTASSLYVSSLCRGGLRAVLVSLPLILGAVALAPVLQSLGFAPLRALSLSLMAQPLTARAHLVLRGVENWLPPVTGGGLIGLLVWLAFANHRSVAREARQVRNQGLSLVAYLTVVILLETAVLAVGNAHWTRWSQQHHVGTHSRSSPEGR
jgi:hypothetical protein